LISVAEHSGFFERFHGRTDKQLQTFLKLQQSIVVLVDFRTLELESKTPFKKQLFRKFHQKLHDTLKNINDKVKRMISETY
jgi:hypothetical protein